MTRLMSLLTTPSSPMKKAVVAPMTSTKDSAVSEYSNSGDMRATMKMPAVTMVAAWISAEIGVGPSIESGSQTCSGTCADLPMAPMKRQMQMSVSPLAPLVAVIGMTAWARCGAAAKAASYESEPVYANTPAMPMMKPKSPTRLTMKAFRLANTALGRVYQKPISRYDTVPTAYQPKNSCMKLSDITSISIEKVNNEM